MLTLHVKVERWPIAGQFTISRGAKTEAVVVVAELTDGAAVGRGEAVPYAHYGESVDGAVATIETLRPQLEGGLTRTELQTALPAGAARNALDCAMWDLEAKQTGRSAASIAGLGALRPVTTAYTLSLASPPDMREAAARASARPLLKAKLGGADVPASIAAVRAGAPKARLIVDANEAWTPETIETNLAACADAGVELIEQPLPQRADQPLHDMARPVPICADESVRDRASLPALLGKYDAINIKLDKAGGLTEALALAAEAERAGLTVMVGCMVATSLAMAPALLIAQRAAIVDLDGPLLLATDRPHGLRYDGSLVWPACPALWG